MARSARRHNMGARRFLASREFEAARAVLSAVSIPMMCCTRRNLQGNEHGPAHLRFCKNTGGTSKAEDRYLSTHVLLLYDGQSSTGEAEHRLCAVISMTSTRLA